MVLFHGAIWGNWFISDSLDIPPLKLTLLVFNYCQQDFPHFQKKNLVENFTSELMTP